MRSRAFIRMLAAAVWLATVSVQAQDSTNVTRVGLAEFACRPRCLAAAAGKVYLAGDDRLLMVDVSDPAHPKVLSAGVTGSHTPQDMVYVSALSYLTDQRGLSVLSLGDQMPPGVLNQEAVPGAGALAFYGHYVYLAGHIAGLPGGGKWGLNIVDVSNPYALSIAGRLPCVDHVNQDNLPDYSLAMYGRTIFLGTRHDLWVIDVSNPEKPRQVLHQANRENLTAMAVVEDYLCLADTRGGRNLITLNRLGSPVQLEEVGALDVQEAVIREMRAYGQYALMMGSNRDFYVLNAMPANQPRLAGRYHFSAGSNQRLAISGNTLYVCDPDFGLWLIDLSSPTTPVLQKSWSLPDRIGNVFVSGKVGCTVDGDLRLLDLSSPEAPREVAVFPRAAAGQETRVAFGINAAYAASGSAIQVLDVSELGRPQPAGTLTLNAPVRAIAANGRVGLAACDDGLRLLDLTAPLHPVVRSTLGAPQVGACTDAAFAGEYACVAEPGSGLKLVNITKLKKPSLAGTLPLPGASAVAVKESFAYVLADTRLAVVTLKDAHKPVLAGNVDLPGGFKSLQVWDNRLLVGAPESGLMIYDLSDPANPRLAGEIHSNYGLHGFAAQGNLIYTAEDRWMGMYQFNNGK